MKFIRLPFDFKVACQYLVRFDPVKQSDTVLQKKNNTKLDQNCLIWVSGLHTLDNRNGLTTDFKALIIRGT